MRGVKDAVEHRVAQVDVAGAHVDLGPQHPGAIGELAGAHAAQEIEVFLDAAPAVGALGAGLGQGAARRAQFLLRLVVDIGLAGADQEFGPVVELLEIIRRVVKMRAPIEAEPAHVALDGIDIFLLLPGRVGVVETQITVAAEFLGNTEIEADRLGVPDMEIAVRLRRESGDDRLAPAGREIGANDVADEILPGFSCRWFRDGHDVIASMLPRRSPRRARIEQIGPSGQVRPARNPVSFLSVLAVLRTRVRKDQDR